MKLRLLFASLGATTALLLPTADANTVLGIGTGALVGNDLTDIGNDGVEGAYNPPGTLGGFDAEFFADREANFGSPEAAFNVFDNTVGSVNAKWCCGDTSPPAFVGAMNFTSIAGPIQLTSFTLTSGNDSGPGSSPNENRDPVDWEIQGSLDTTTGLDGTWTTIYDHPLALGNDFTARNQVIQYSPADGDTFLSTDGFTAFRLRVDATEGGATSGNYFQLNELEFFGTAAQVPSGGSTLPMLLGGVAGLFLLRSKRKR